MNEPTRWLQDPNTASRLVEVLEAAPPPPVMPAALQAKLGTYVATLAASGTSALATPAVVTAKVCWLSGVGVAKTALVLGLLGAAGTAGYEITDGRLLPNASTAVSEAPAAPQKRVTHHAENIGNPPRPEEGTTATQVVFSPSASADPPRRDSAIQPSASELSGRAKTPAPELGGLTEEARVLESARRALVQDPEVALHLAERHAQLYPAGQLSAERELIAVDALLRLGHRSEAELRAQPRLQAAPDGIYARRLRQLLDARTP